MKKIDENRIFDNLWFLKTVQTAVKGNTNEPISALKSVFV